MNNHVHGIQWIAPLVIGTIGFVCCLYAFLIEQRSDWNLIALALISAAFLGAGIFNKISITKEGGFIIEMAQASVHGLSTLETAVKANAEALQQMSKRVDEIASLAVELSKSPQASTALAAQGEALSVEPSDLTSALNSLGSSVKDVIEGVSAAKKTVGTLLDYVGWSDEEPADTPQGNTGH